ncbi:MAG TPA: hypothetical protein PLW66_06610, partial [Saprospiraceae bacterium]|nr:hypothetical protein [Saprospiraceae bacterium]
MKQHYSSLLFLLLFTTMAGAQIPSPACTTPSAEETLHGNRLRVRLTADGNAKQVAGSTAFVADYDGSPFPKLNLWTGGLWLGGLDTAGNLKLAALNHLSYWQHYFPGPLGPDGELTDENCNQWNRIWKVSRYAIEAHRADYNDNQQIDQPIAAVVGWPGRGNPFFESLNGFALTNDTMALAPFFDYNNDGIYNAFEGDFPHPEGLTPEVSVSEMLWMIFNSGGSNLDCDIHSTVWALQCDGNDVLNSTYFQSFKVVNRGTMRLDSFILGIWQPIAYGCPLFVIDIGTKPDLHTVYVYSNRPNIGPCLNLPGFGENKPVGALTILNAPLYKSIYIIDPSIGQFPPAIIHSSLPIGHYRFLNGRWNDGSPLTYGWTGYTPQNPFAIPVDHYFTGDPNDPGSWAAVNEQAPLVSFESLASVKIGTLNPGQSRTIDVAFSYHLGEGLDGLQNVSYMFDRVAELRQSYDQQFEDVCDYTPCMHNDCVWPGDANRDGTVDHTDLLPLGVAYNAEGPQRDAPVIWAPLEADSWGLSYNQSYDYKHLDPNGNGKVDDLDISLIRDFLGSTTLNWAQPPDEYPVGDDLRPKAVSLIDTNNVLAGQKFFAAVEADWFPELHGLAYEMEWDTAYWFVDAVNFSSLNQDGFRNLGKSYSNKLQYALTYTYPGPLPSFPNNNFTGHFIRFNAKAIPPTQPATTYIRLKNIKGVAPDGSPLVLGAQPLKFVFAGGSSGAGSPDGTAQWRVTPNPATETLRIETPDEQMEQVVFYDLSGKMLERRTLGGG